MGRSGSRDPEHESKDEGFSRAVLLGTDPGLRFGRRVLRRVPSDPRCKLCTSPFTGLGGWVMRRIGKGPWPKNPEYCSACFKQLSEHGAGAEIECSLLFADVRGSTTLAEGMRPAEFRALMHRFFETATQVLIEHDAVVDKFVGDEIVAIFIPALTGERHAARAVAAARDLLAATASWIPVGAGVHTAVAFVGTVGEGDHTEFTAMGDPVNIAARLASAAGGGEVLVTSAAAQSAGLDVTGLEHRNLALKGKTQPTEVVVLGASA
jgi:adenylate cyclase